MVEAVAMTITGALEMGTEAETVTQAAEAMSTQVAAIVLEDKTEVFPLPWKGATLLHVIHTAARAAEPPGVAAVGGAALIEVEAKADTKTFKAIGPSQFFPPTNGMWKFCLHSLRTTEKVVFTFFYCCLLKFPSVT